MYKRMQKIQLNSSYKYMARRMNPGWKEKCLCACERNPINILLKQLKQSGVPKSSMREGQPGVKTKPEKRPEMKP